MEPELEFRYARLELQMRLGRGRNFINKLYFFWSIYRKYSAIGNWSLARPSSHGWLLHWQEAGVKPFPTPFVEGFGWDETGELVFPGRPEVRPQLQLQDRVKNSAKAASLCTLSFRRCSSALSPSYLPGFQTVPRQPHALWA